MYKTGQPLHRPVHYSQFTERKADVRSLRHIRKLWYVF